MYYEFKEELDKFLEGLPNEKKVRGVEYTSGASDLFSAQPSNFIIDQIWRMKNGGSNPPFLMLSASFPSVLTYGYQVLSELWI